MADQNFDGADYVETDPLGVIAKNGTQVDMTGLSRATPAATKQGFMFKDFGAGLFDNSAWTQYSAFVWTAGNANYSIAAVWMLTNTQADFFTNTAYVNLYVGYDGSSTKVTLRQDTGSEVNDVGLTLTLSQNYYVAYIHDPDTGANGTLYAYIYTDAARETVFDVLSITLLADVSYQYFGPVCSHNDDAGSTVWSGSVWGFDLDLISLIDRGLGRGIMRGVERGI